jgi:type II pantothenate kinase
LLQGFDELLSLAEKGDHRNADILVKDTCGLGGVYASYGLPDDLIASSFGKAARCRGSPDKSCKGLFCNILKFQVLSIIFHRGG